MSLTPLQLVLISSGLSLTGALIGAAITYCYAVRLAKRNARREAGRQVREAFRPEIAAMDPVAGEEGRDVERLLREAWPKHHAAVSELMFHLPPHERAALETAWRAYYEVGGSIRFFDYHFGDKPWEIFQERVNDILKWTVV